MKLKGIISGIIAVIFVLLIIHPMIFSYVLNGYYWEKDPSTGTAVPDYYYDEASAPILNTDIAISGAISTWNGAGACFGFDAEPYGNEEVYIKFQSLGTGANAPVGTWTKSSIGFELQYATVLLNWDLGIQWSINCLSNKYDVESAVLHELGHPIGLDHSPVTTSVMIGPPYQNYTLLPGECKRDLDSDDINGIQAIYGECGGPVACSPTSQYAALIASAEMEMYDPTIRFIEQEVKIKHNGLLNFYFNHQDELQKIIFAKNSLRIETKRIIEKLLSDLSHFVTPEGKLRQNPDGPIFSLKDKTQYFNFFDEIEKSATKNLKKNISNFRSFIQDQIGKSYGQILSEILNETNANSTILFENFTNYPNPFNPETKIEYRLLQPARVTIKIYDIVGRELTTLLDEKQQPGNHSVKWDGRNKNGVQVSSGVYFYKIQAGQFEKINKITLLR